MFFNEPEIINQPKDTAIDVGANLNVSPDIMTRDMRIFPYDHQSPPIFYQWYKWSGTDWLPVDGQTSKDLTVSVASEGDAGSYGLIAYNQAGIAATEAVEVVVITLSSWIDSFAEIPAAEATAEGDFDEDGFPHLFEYAFGMDPLVKETRPPIETKIEGGVLKVSYNRRRGDLTYTVQASRDLIQWDSVGVDQGSQALGPVVASVPMADESKRFLRIKIEQNTP